MRYIGLFFSVVLMLTLVSVASSEPKPAITHADLITIHELKRRLDGGQEIIILDVRDSYAYRESVYKIEGAKRITLKRLGEKFHLLPKGNDIVTYCSEFEESLAQRAAVLLLNNGLPNVKVLKGGFGAWTFYDYPIELK